MLFSKLRKDPFFFFRYVTTKTLLFSMIFLICFISLPISPNYLIISLLGLFFFFANPYVLLTGLAVTVAASAKLNETDSFIIILLMFLGIFLGGWLTMIIHNTAHEQIKPRWINRTIGELAGFTVMMGFINFLYIHILHHIHEDTEKDPHHNIEGVSFFNYISLSAKNIGLTYREFLTTKVCKNKIQLITVIACVMINKLLTMQILLFVFGEVLFVNMILPCMIANQLFFAYLNYYTHPMDDQNRKTIVNLNDSLGHKFANFFYAGILYHKTHHERPQAFNPQRYYNLNN